VSAIGGDSLRDSFASRDLGGGGDSTRLGLTHGGPETGFFSESVGWNALFVKKPGFFGPSASRNLNNGVFCG
jgi:hypothetical protein